MQRLKVIGLAKYVDGQLPIHRMGIVSITAKPK